MFGVIHKHMGIIINYKQSVENRNGASRKGERLCQHVSITIEYRKVLYSMV